MERYLPGSDLSPSFLKTGTTDGDFEQEGKQDSAKYLLYILVRTGESSGEHILKTMAGILLGPMALEQPFWRRYSLFSTRWKIGKLLGTIIKGGIV